MPEPEFFILFFVVGAIFAGCLATAGVWFYFGWRKKVRLLQFLAAVPLGIGIFLVGPFLVLLFVLLALWIFAGVSSKSPSDLSKPPPVSEGIIAKGRDA
jgi:hypothetical protein